MCATFRCMCPQIMSTRREIELDFIRGIATLMVLVSHYRSHNLLVTSYVANRIEGFGWVGVDIFFVLSGFLVGGLLVREWSLTGSVDAVRFLKRRAFKIWPAYYTFLLVATVIHVRPLRSFFWQNLLNVQNYFPSSMSHTWSLAVEEHFYVTLMAIVFLWTARNWKPATLLCACLMLSVLVQILRAVLLMHGCAAFFTTHTRIDALLLGVSLAVLRTFWPRWFAALQRMVVPLAIVVAVGLWRLYVDNDAYPEPKSLTSPWLITFVDYAAAALLLLLYRPGGQHGRLYRVVSRVGIFSYGIYLWHVSVERPVDWAVAHVPQNVVSVTSTLLPYALAMPLGIVMTKAVELPFLRLRERLVPSRIKEPNIPNA